MPEPPFHGLTELRGTIRTPHNSKARSLLRIVPHNSRKYRGDIERMIKNGDIHRWEWWDAPEIKIKCGCRLDEGMMETLLIAGACIFTIFLGFWLHLRWSVRFIAEQFAHLDAKLAEALTKTLENLPIGDVEPVNPMQMMLMQIIQDNMAKNPAKIVNRDDQGQFTSESDSKSEK